MPQKAGDSGRLMELLTRTALV
ncbi:hypothetical protein B14911_23870 [Bacillus sp. NRRL B-14911]|nr:hypothetical protein B14911_23870 [Bacillus sp. NRRL B-14911]